MFAAIPWRESRRWARRRHLARRGGPRRWPRPRREDHTRVPASASARSPPPWQKTPGRDGRSRESPGTCVRWPRRGRQNWDDSQASSPLPGCVGVCWGHKAPPCPRQGPATPWPGRRRPPRPHLAESLSSRISGAMRTTHRHTHYVCNPPTRSTARLTPPRMLGLHGPGDSAAAWKEERSAFSGQPAMLKADR